MSKDRCQQSEQWLMLYLFDELPSLETERMGAHVAECGRCRDELDRLSEALDLLGSLKAGRLDGDRMATLQTAARSRLHSRDRSGPRRAVPTTLAVAASLLLCTMIALMMRIEAPKDPALDWDYGRARIIEIKTEMRHLGGWPQPRNLPMTLMSRMDGRIHLIRSRLSLVALDEPLVPLRPGSKNEERSIQ